ncbi:MAG: hypothetical protein IME93_05785 [Proteobacteria bacterium]|nr:hypothetical protein [Pseudomonadota bacterium]
MVKSEKRGGIVREILHEAAEQRLTDMGDQLPRCCVRPPFAIAEAEFLRSCSRCADCLHACSHHILHLLPVRCGFLRSGTPAMELCKQGCHLCDGWPCVAACDTGALKMPPGNELPKLGRLAVLSQQCLASHTHDCHACIDACPIEGAISLGSDSKPLINEAQCPGCGLCLESCVADPKAIAVQFVT